MLGMTTPPSPLSAARLSKVCPAARSSTTYLTKSKSNPASKKAAAELGSPDVELSKHDNRCTPSSAALMLSRSRQFTGEKQQHLHPSREPSPRLPSEAEEPHVSYSPRSQNEKFNLVHIPFNYLIPYGLEKFSRHCPSVTQQAITNCSAWHARAHDMPRPGAPSTLRLFPGAGLRQSLDVGREAVALHKVGRSSN